MIREDFDKLPIRIEAKLVADWLLRRPPGVFTDREIQAALRMGYSEIDFAWVGLKGSEFNSAKQPGVFECPEDCKWRKLYELDDGTDAMVNEAMKAAEPMLRDGPPLPRVNTVFVRRGPGRPRKF